jgi:RimJ/RimL family protein N-acetyltransferase
VLNLNFNPFPVLYTERLLLRNFNKNDANDLFNLRSDKNVMRFIDRPKAKSLKDALELINKMHDSLKNNNGITWAISLKSNNALIGTIGFWRIMNEHYRAEIGYLLHADFHAKGIMHEAMKPVLKYGFNIMNLHSVEANLNPENTASIKLLEKNGFVKEAFFKENYYYNGKFLDTLTYSLLAQNCN